MLHPSEQDEKAVMPMPLQVPSQSDASLCFLTTVWSKRISSSGKNSTFHASKTEFSNAWYTILFHSPFCFLAHHPLIKAMKAYLSLDSCSPVPPSAAIASVADNCKQANVPKDAIMHCS